MFLVQLIVFQIIIFGALILALRHILTRNISSATSHLDHLNDEFVRREEEVKARQVEADKYYQETTAKAKDDADALRLDAGKKIQEEKDKILEAARIQSEEMIAKAEKTKSLMVNELKNEMETRVTGHIRDILIKIFPEKLQEEIHHRWIQDLLSGEVHLLANVRIPEEVDAVQITSAFALLPRERDALKAKFKSQVGREFTFEENVDASLLGGFIVVVGSLVLDGTIVNKVQQLTSEHV
jgi:F0F1-type ATP synthase membrane subunit b/b'